MYSQTRVTFHSENIRLYYYIYFYKVGVVDTNQGTGYFKMNSSAFLFTYSDLLIPYPKTQLFQICKLLFKYAEWF